VVTLLVMLNLSATFGTVNHDILISRLHEEVGVSGLAPEWFRSYLQNRTQRVAVNGTFSERFALDHGVPQGSCLGPLLFIIYSSKLFKVIRDQLPEAHCCADDTQLYLSFKPHSDASQTAAINAMECCIEKIREWIIRDKLTINDSKTEFILIGTRQQLSKLQPCAISVGHDTNIASTQVKNLGCWLDSHLSVLLACANQLFTIFII